MTACVVWCCLSVSIASAPRRRSRPRPSRSCCWPGPTNTRRPRGRRPFTRASSTTTPPTARSASRRASTPTALRARTPTARNSSASCTCRARRSCWLSFVGKRVRVTGKFADVAADGKVYSELWPAQVEEKRRGRGAARAGRRPCPLRLAAGGSAEDRQARAGLPQRPGVGPGDAAQRRRHGGGRDRVDRPEARRTGHRLEQADDRHRRGRASRRRRGPPRRDARGSEGQDDDGLLPAVGRSRGGRFRLPGRDGTGGPHRRRGSRRGRTGRAPKGPAARKGGPTSPVRRGSEPVCCR